MKKSDKPLFEVKRHSKANANNGRIWSVDTPWGEYWFRTRKEAQAFAFSYKSSKEKPQC